MAVTTMLAAASTNGPITYPLQRGQQIAIRLINRTPRQMEVLTRSGALCAFRCVPAALAEYDPGRPLVRLTDSPSLELLQDWMSSAAWASASAGSWWQACQAVLRTVSVAVSAMDRPDARVHGHIDGRRRPRTAYALSAAPASA